MGDNMRIYDQVRICPPEAQKPITGGNLNGKTDINPMWRIKTLTEQFGPCGIGWKTENEKFWTDTGANGEVIAWCSMSLRYKQGDEWSAPVFGIGGSMLVATQRGKLASNDEAYKMAYTDAISVACKSLGFAADIYWEADRTKYGDCPGQPEKVTQFKVCAQCGKAIKDGKKPDGTPWPALALAKYTMKRWNKELCCDCCYKMDAAEKAVSAGADGPL